MKGALTKATFLFSLQLDLHPATAGSIFNQKKRKNRMRTSGIAAILFLVALATTVLSSLGCSDFGEEPKEYVVVQVGTIIPYVEIVVIGPVIHMSNDLQAPIYYDSYPTTCEDCVNEPVCTDPPVCTSIAPNGSVSFERIEGGTTIRWWHLIAEGGNYEPDSVRYLFVP